MLPRLLMGLDVVSALLTLLVAAFFVRSWRRTGLDLHLLMAAGFALVGASFLGASVTHYGLVPEDGFVHAARATGQLGGALVLAFAYITARWRGRATPWLVGGWVLVAMSVLGAFLYAADPFGSFPPATEMYPFAHALMVVAYGICAWLSLRGAWARPGLDRLLVPFGFVAWGLTKYTWLLIDLSGAQGLAPFVYAWRLAAIGLFLAAVALPPRPEARNAPA